jgi:hypothetical protein
MARNLSIKLIVLSFFLFGKGFSQNEKFKALFMYNFTKYIEWPFEYQQGDFTIGVFGSSPIVTELEMIASKRKAGNQTLIIQQFNSVNDLRKCHILYIPTNKSASLQDILNKIGSNPTLVITDAPGLAHKGSLINYVLKGSQQDFEINKRKIESVHLKINSTLLSLGTIINP